MIRRDINLDFLRVISAFAVVLLHVSAKVVLNHPDLSDSGWWVGNIINAFTRWSVPVFVMISGALFLSESSNVSPERFYRHRAVRLVIPLLFWTMFYLAMQVALEGKFDLGVQIKNVVLGRPYFHLWYLYMIVGLYLFSPFVRIFVQASDRDTLILFCIITFTISGLETLLASLFKGGGNTFLSLFLPYISYFVCGHLLNTSEIPRYSLMKLFLTLFLVLILAGSVAAALPFLGSKTWGVVHSNFEPLVIFLSIACFQLGRSITAMPLILRRAIGVVSPLTLGIYLIHPLWLELLAKFVFNGFAFHPALSIPLTFFAGMGLSILSIGILIRIPLINSIVK